MMRILNGVLITGGSAQLFNDTSTLCQYKKMLDKTLICPSDYMKTIDFIINNAKKINDEGNHFPIWTTCLGYEALIISLSNFTIKRAPIYSENHSLNLILNPSFIKNFSPTLTLKMINNL